jgi:hypothetical protein
MLCALLKPLLVSRFTNAVGRGVVGIATILFNFATSKVADASQEERFICSASQTREADKLSASSPLRPTL